ncbi:hypothetical protein PLIIFM63780_005907 [Purpureocillium lilacinum]|uniref:uncharacterized protein n=1 Tax=Purpureocillium lilacinum TaxID=33203 RepID=UPI002082CACE|nr:hypothetical protein PLICBS_005827 [Purpureocillium lilacinum]GJN82367.1 hypothetical protein PLIIFM63780_005907 [Purpureocillium lilacinum]
MLTWFGLVKSHRRDGEREPLLPQYNDETAREARLHEKLHTYQMLRAMSQGYMPSNEQVVVQLRSLLSADILNPDTQELSSSGRALTSSTKLWLTQFIKVLQHKNSEDQIQDFIWYLSKARLDIDTRDLGVKAAASKAKADASATLASLRTVGSLLLTNSDFRIFLDDLGTVGKEVFRDTAFTLADVSKEAGQQLAPATEATDALSAQGGSTHTVPSNQDLEDQVQEVAQVVSSGAAEVASEAGHSLSEHVTGSEGKALVHRLKQTVVQLRKRRDYSESVSTLALLLQRYLAAYARLASDTVQAVEEDVGTNEDADLAVRNFWRFLTSLGNQERWKQVEASFDKVVEAGRSDPNFEKMVQEIATLVQDMLTDPDFFDNAEQRFNDLRNRSKETTSRSSIADSVDELLTHLRLALRSVTEDEDMQKLLRISKRIAALLSPQGSYKNDDLVQDSINTFVPLVVQAIQYVPIPRLEVSTPAVDLLLENLILEPGRTINHSSFLPYRLQISTQNDFAVQKGLFRTTSSMASVVRVKISGLSIAADDLGYWVKLHSGLLRIMDQGLVSFHLDERGIDITLDIEIGRNRIEELVSLRSVKVDVHHLNYKLSDSKFSWIAWLLKPLIRPIVRKALELKVAAAIEQGLRTLNRELVFARERLRATRIANPNDLWTFLRAVAARLTPAPDPDLDARVGVRPGRDVFRGRYAPGSLVKLWDDEGRDAPQRVLEYERGGWRNEIFDVKTVAAGSRRVAQV